MELQLQLQGNIYKPLEGLKLIAALSLTIIILITLNRGYGYRSTGHFINGPNINELEINCSIDQQNPVDVLSIILTNMLLRSTAPHINKYS
jgi:hypothetical protein